MAQTLMLLTGFSLIDFTCTTKVLIIYFYLHSSKFLGCKSNTICCTTFFKNNKSEKPSCIKSFFMNFQPYGHFQNEIYEISARTLIFVVC